MTIQQWASTGRFDILLIVARGAVPANGDTNAGIRVHARSDGKDRCQKNKNKQKMKSNIKSTLAVLGCVGLSAGASFAQAIDSNFNANDLILGFRAASGSPGAANVLMINLGSASLYKDANINNANFLNFANIGSQLQTTFGTGIGAGNWYERTDLFGSFASAINGTTADNNAANLSITVQNSTLGTGVEFNSTIYISSVRSAPGAVGSSNSTIPGGVAPAPGQLATNVAGSNILAVGTGAFTTNQVGGVATVASGGVNNWNSTGNVGNGVDWGIFNTEGSFGSNLGSFGGATDVAQYWDLYRLARWGTASSPSQPTVDPLSGRGFFQGTLTLSQNGDVSYLVVPEPTSMLLVSLGLGALALSRRRRTIA